LTRGFSPFPTRRRPRTGDSTLPYLETLYTQRSVPKLYLS
jgi:hypothetical protein